MQVLQATSVSRGNWQVVYPLLKENLDKLDLVFLEVLRRWCRDKLANEEQNRALIIAGDIVNFSNLIEQFPLGNRAINIEIVIAGYENALTIFSRDGYPEYWAMTQNNLGNAYFYKIEGNRSKNLEEAIKCYQAALEVRTRNVYPEKWAETQNNLGGAYSDRKEGNRSDNLEKAIKYYKAALKEYTRHAYPEKWAMTEENLAYLCGYLGEIDLEIRGLYSALEIFTATGYPLKCLKAGRSLGNTGFENQRWEDAIKGYGDAIEAVEILRNW